MENIQRENLNPIEEATAFSIRIKSLILEEYGNKVNLLPYQEEIQDKIAEISAFSDNSKYVKQLSDLYSLSASSIANNLILMYHG